MKCFVTGASGFIGSNLVRELAARGHEVKVLVRPESDLRALAGVECERVPGDLADREGLERKMAGCQWCFHVAASYHLWLPDYQPMYAANVQGARNVLDAARRASCLRIVHTSTVGCIGLPKTVNGRLVPSDETRPFSEDQLAIPYKASKWQAERIAVELARAGAPVVIVNPSAPIGPGDVKPTPTGQLVLDFLNRKLPAYVDTGLNWVHVRDVAAGHILAAEKGRIGERYILGNAEGNWTMKETLQVLEDLTGVPAPKLKIPHWVAKAAAQVDEGLSFFTKRPPRVPKAGAEMAGHKMWFNPAKAVRELGLPQTPPRQAFADAIAWFRANGYVKK
ncbi:MAG: NAD-dependent epimerase/dehydratase family protein [Verrucomicrobiota bacterium]|nr:NAD-dependent epimerase/dehydratase family protein [Verrucomicrobiota bacterium]